MEELKLLSYDLRDYSDSLDIDEKELDSIENRMSLINRLKRKYGFSIEKIDEYRNSSYEELKLLLEADSKLNSFIMEKNKLFKALSENAETISKRRKEAAEFLEKQILVELSDLNMKNIKFKVNIDKKEISIDGIDNVEFLISTNVGSDLNSVQKIVSGGEASRIMLAFKKIKSDIGQTMVFDEIDTGISGKTAVYRYNNTIDKTGCFTVTKVQQRSDELVRFSEAVHRSSRKYFTRPFGRCTVIAK